MSEEAELLKRRAAYIDTVRGRHVKERNAGFVACLVGAMMIVAARFAAGVPAWLLWAGLAVIAVGWALFAWSIFARVAYVRAHPFATED